MIFIRFILISIIVYLIIKAFLNFATDEHKSSAKYRSEGNGNNPPKKVSKEIGEYIDYEEVKKEKQHKASSKS
jgi:large-conductance mechanosensitive channel